VLVGLLVAAGVAAVLVDGAPSMAVAWVLGVLVGGPTPIVEVLNGGQAASVVALVFALAATLAASFMLRVARRDG
jgi:hypothetical protein